MERLDLFSIYSFPGVHCDLHYSYSVVGMNTSFPGVDRMNSKHMAGRKVVGNFIEGP